MKTTTAGPAPCDRCNGSGMRAPAGDDDLGGQYQPCPACHGYGHRSRAGARQFGWVGRSLVIVAAVAMIVVTLMVISTH